MNGGRPSTRNNYLAIALGVLRSVRRPLTPREIMADAYKQGIVPHHLHGRTQHKTLQARLSEDILSRRERSAFYRTSPGKFFLRELLQDEQLPDNFRTPIVARRRARDLPKKDVLVLSREVIESIAKDDALADQVFESFIRSRRYNYISNIGDAGSNDVPVWTFSVVIKGSMILSYRQGQYRENRDTFLEKRCIGFYNLVTDSDLTLFDQNDHGLLSNSIRALSMDLDLPPGVFDAQDKIKKAGFVYATTAGRHDLLAVIECRTPEWFEPLGRRLSLNDLAWIDSSYAPNNLDDFDPWSQAVLGRIRNSNSSYQG
jgi:hypothetical protein